MIDGKVGKIGQYYIEPMMAYELDIYEHVPLIDPTQFGILGARFDSRPYFITSGDAVAKTKILIRDLQDYVRRIRGGSPWLSAARRAEQGALNLLDHLISARGSHVFLESEWDDHRLWVIPKDPRHRGSIDD